MYNDYQVADNLSIKAMRQKFDEIHNLETQDLNEIYKKMTEQRQILTIANNNGKLNMAIEKLSNCISNLETIINKNSRQNNHTLRYHNGLYCDKIATKTNLPDSDVYGKIPSQFDMDQHSATPPLESNQNTQQPSPQNGFNNINSGANLDTPQPSPTRPKRNYPMQGSIISRLAKSLFVNHKKERYSSILPKYRNRFHNTFVQNDDCHPRQHLVNNQIDLIRLLLLFVALRPNCKYLSRIANITSTQLDILMDIMD